MAKTEYDIVWKKGGWFEDGHFALVPKKSFGDKAGEALIGYVLILALLLFVFSLIALTSPLWIVIIGFQMVREKRYYTGIISLLALGYFYLDIKKQWITSFLFFGYTNDKGEIVNGLLNPKYLEHFEMINLIAVGLGLAYVIDAVLISKYGKKFNDDRITTPQLVIYFGGMVIGFLLSSSMKIEGQIIKDSPVEEVVEASPVPESNSYAVADTTSVYTSEDFSDSIASENLENEVSTSEDVVLSEIKLIVQKYFVDITNENFNAENYFANDVSQYISLKNTSPYEINKNYNLYDKKEYLKQEFFYDINSLRPNGISENGDITYLLDLRGKWYRKSKGNYQESDITLVIVFNSQNKITSLKYNDIQNTKYYKSEQSINTKKQINNRDPQTKDRANVFYNSNYTLFDLLTDEPIYPDQNGIYNIWYSSNENPKPFSITLTLDELTKFRYYKFKNERNCKKWCESR